MNNFIEKTKRFLREVKAEMAKVTWPTWPELKGSTILVIIVSIFFAVYVGLVDMALSIIRNLWL
jgi:preprotein translocase subunit SecE